MNPEIEKIYMDLLIAMGRIGMSKKVYLVFSIKQRGGKFIPIPEGDYREDKIGFDGYELVCTYMGNKELRYSRLCEDIYAFLQESENKQYGNKPELRRFAKAG